VPWFKSSKNFRHEDTKKEKSKVKFQNVNCKIAVWPMAMFYIPSF